MLKFHPNLNPFSYEDALFKKRHPLFSNRFKYRLKIPSGKPFHKTFQIMLRFHKRRQKNITLSAIRSVICKIYNFPLFLEKFSISKQHKDIRIRFLIEIAPDHGAKEDNTQQVISLSPLYSTNKFPQGILYNRLKKRKSIKRLLHGTFCISFQHLCFHLDHHLPNLSTYS